MSRRIPQLAVPTLLIAAVFASFAPAIDSFFVGDDFDFLRSVGRMEGVVGALTQTFWGEYMPAFTLTFMLDMRLWDMEPAGYHLTSLLFHVAAVLALFWLTLTLSGGDRLVAAASALLFAVIPIHDEAVIYIAARGHVMMSAFLFLALACHARYRRGGHGLLLLPATLSLALGLLSKETAILALALVVFAELLVLRDGRRGRALAGIAPFALLCIGYPLYRVLVLGVSEDKVMRTLEYGWEWDRLPLYFLLEALPLPGSWLGDSAERWLSILGAAALLAASIWAVRRYWRERSGLALYALALFTICSAPFLLDTLSVRRRYAYASSFGVCLFLAVLLIGLWRADGRWKRRLGAAALVLLIATGFAMTVERSLLYRRSGEIARNIAGDLAAIVPPGVEDQKVYLFQLPYRVGGGSLDGAYLLHDTDFRSVVRVFGGTTKARLRKMIGLEYSEDHDCRVRVDQEGLIVLKMTSATERAHRSLVGELQSEEGRGPFGRMNIQRIDDDERSVVVSVRPDDPDPEDLVLVYCDGHLRQV